MNRWLVAGLLAALAGAGGCSKKQDVIVRAADRQAMTDAEIDADPVALLPGGALAIVNVDTNAFFASEFGQQMKALANARIPLPPSAGFDPQRDLTRMYIGLYSMQGVDTLAVARGTFSPDAISRAADGVTNTPLGAPLVKTTYAKHTLYVSRNIGFVVLTAHTVLLGDETGLRRALDRLSEGRVVHGVAKWVDKVLATPNAAMAAAVDVKGKPLAEGVARSFAFLSGLETGRIIGNFQSPGMNFAGTLTYSDAEAAKNGAAGILALEQRVRSYSFLMSLIGVGNPIQKLEAVPSGKDAQFVLSLEARTIQWLLGQLADRFVAGAGR